MVSNEHACNFWELVVEIDWSCQFLVYGTEEQGGSAEKKLSCMSETSTAVKFEVSLYIYHLCTVEFSFS